MAKQKVPKTQTKRDSALRHIPPTKHRADADFVGHVGSQRYNFKKQKDGSYQSRMRWQIIKGGCII